MEKIESLDLKTERLLHSLSQFDEELLHDSSYGGSIMQVLSHLERSEYHSLGYMKKKILAGDDMPVFKWIDQLKMKLTEIALKSSLKWKAPEYVANPDGNYTLGEIAEIWKDTRKKIKEFVEEYPEQHLNKSVYKHPSAGRQNLKNAIDSFDYHFIHHEYQIKRIKNHLHAYA